MDPRLEPIAQALRDARKRKGISQRALATLAGVPQSHISKIEAGAVDLRLSSLMELSRALEMEPMLVPRKVVITVQAIVGNVNDGDEPLAKTGRRAYTLDDND